MQLNKAKIAKNLLDGNIGFTLPFLSTRFGKQIHDTVFVSKIKKKNILIYISKDYSPVSDYWAQFDWQFSRWSTAMQAHYPQKLLAHKLVSTFRSKAKTVTEIFSLVPKQKKFYSLLT